MCASVNPLEGCVSGARSRNTLALVDAAGEIASTRSLIGLRSDGGPAPHVMLLLEPPRLAPVAGFLSAPGEGVVLDVVERPTQLVAVVVLASKDDAISLDPTLYTEQGAVLWVDEYHVPRPGFVVEEADRSA